MPILSTKVDIANVRMEFESGCVANFTASRVSTERIRKLRFFQPHQYVSVDYSRQDVLVITVDELQPEAAELDPFNPDKRGCQRLSRHHAVQAEGGATGAAAGGTQQLSAGRARAFRAGGDASGRQASVGSSDANC